MFHAKRPRFSSIRDTVRGRHDDHWSISAHMMFSNRSENDFTIDLRKIQIEENDIGARRISRLSHHLNELQGFLSIREHMERVFDLVGGKGLLNQQHVPKIVLDEKYIYHRYSP